MSLQTSEESGMFGRIIGAYRVTSSATGGQARLIGFTVPLYGNADLTAVRPQSVRTVAPIADLVRGCGSQEKEQGVP
jgi:hypothetical protein